MSRESTVCQFCGVSYLIHHEMKKLEETVAALKRDLVDYKDSKQREENLKDELLKSRNAVTSFERIVATAEDV